MQRLEVSGAVRPIEGSLGVKGLRVRDNRTGVTNTLDTNTSLYSKCIKVKFVPRKENYVFPLQITMWHVV